MLASKELGIALYMPNDGKYRVLDVHIGAEKKLFPRNKDLRLIGKDKVTGSHWQGDLKGLNDDVAYVVIIGNTYAKLMAGKKAAGVSTRGNRSVYEQRKETLDKAIDTLLWEAAGAMKSVFEGLEDAVIDCLESQLRMPYKIEKRRKNAPGEGTSEHKSWQRQILAASLLDYAVTVTDQADDENNAALSIIDVETAAQVLAVLKLHARRWKVKLPKQLDKLAAEYDVKLAALGVGEGE